MEETGKIYMYKKYAELRIERWIFVTWLRMKKIRDCSQRTRYYEFHEHTARVY